jgi:putative copper export protein
VNLVTDTIIKTCLYVGTLAFVGPGVYQHFVMLTSDADTSERRYPWLTLIGFLLVVGGSLVTLVLPAYTILGRFDLAFVWKYANATWHGQMISLRLAFALFLLVVLLSPKWRGKATVFSLVALGFFATFAALSHAAMTHGTLALAADLVHMTAATLWVSAVGFSVVSKVTPERIQRVSGLGLLSVCLLLATGIYATLLQATSFSFFMNSSYGQVLMLKLGVFTAILFLAALNKWYFMPKLMGRRANFRRVLGVEAVLLVLVFLLTGILSTVAPPTA